MNRIKVTMSKPYKTWALSIVMLAWCSGLTFFILKTWFMVEGDFGLEKHPWQFPVLQIHGITAFFIMITYGYFIGTHVKTAWKVKPRRILGILLVIMQGFLITTAYLLYYVAEDFTRDAVGYLHLAIGLILPFILLAHIYSHLKNQKKQKFLKRLRINKTIKIAT